MLDVAHPIVLADGVELEGHLAIPPHATGIVVFAHGSGSSRHSPRNIQVAETLEQSGLATLLVDLLTAGEEAVDRVTRQFRFDIRLLARRLTGVLDWLASQGPVADLPVGIFGASTGAAAALIAAASRPAVVRAVVSRGGRPDLAAPALARVRSPTLLIVGGADSDVLELNRQALELIGTAEKQLVVVPGATHLFEEPGALEQVAGAAAVWFSRRLAASSG